MYWLPLSHVKWFTTTVPGQPEPLSEVLNTTFLAGAGLTLLTALLFTLLNVPLQRLPFVERIHGFLDQFRPYTLWIMRVGMALPLILAGLDGYLFHYELHQIPGWMRAAQVALGVAVLVPAVSRAAAAGVGLLYLAGMAVVGPFPMLDYVAWLGAAYFLLSEGKGAALPVLYITTGLSLSWAAVEKWVYPHMALDILSREPVPTFGVPPQEFLVLAGWVELGVGYLLITGVLNRFLSLVVTLLFVGTSALFGGKEIIGHWQLHAALLVFLAGGTGPYVTPVLWHRGRALQLAFVGVTLVPFVAGLIWLYYTLA
ncbi:MAG: DoxX family membrane protein [Bacillota bacterium]